jgi:hypothetical protein
MTAAQQPADVDAARKLADVADSLGRVLVGEPVVVDLFKIRITIANILSEQAATIRSLATALEQARAERDEYRKFSDITANTLDTFRGKLTAAEQRERVMLEAPEKIDKLSALWEGRAEAPYWNLGDIARAALAAEAQTEAEGGGK